MTIMSIHLSRAGSTGGGGGGGGGLKDCSYLHKDITDTLNLSEITEEFISFLEERRFFWISFVPEWKHLFCF